MYARMYVFGYIMYFCGQTLGPPKKQKSLVSGRRTRRPKPARRHFEFFLICYDTMSNCSQNCWIDLEFCRAVF